jgi:ornithine carbamoyltransferase
VPKKDFINIGDFSPAELANLLQRAIADKAEFRDGRLAPSLPGKTLAMIFEKPSLRTRVSFEAAMTHLGGHAINLTPADVGIGTREPVEDAARVLGRMCDGIMARTFSHELVEKLARYAPVPVINGLTDYSHPCQAMADLMTMQEHFGRLAQRTLVFVGDGNNVARSLAMLCASLGVGFVLACPKGYELDEPFLAQLREKYPQASVQTLRDPAAAVAHADVIYTDTWISMGQEQEKAARIRTFGDYQVNAALMAKAPAGAIVMHCLPAYRGNEISADVMDRYADIIFAQAENRMHFQRSLLTVLMAEGGVSDGVGAGKE